MAKTEGQAAAAAGEIQEERSLLDQLIDEGRFGKDESARKRGRAIIKEYVAEVLDGTITVAEDSISAINARLAQIDALISEQLNEIMHHEEFQKVESTWRGLQYLLARTETGSNMKIRMLNASKKELLKDFQRSPGFDQSALFKKVYEHEYGTFGGAPFGALVGDYEFGPTNQDIELLGHVSNVAAAAHAPFITGTSADMFKLEEFTQLGNPRDLSSIFDSTEFAKWKAFRNSEDSRYVALTLPRMLLREPYGRDTIPVEAFDYEEGVDGRDHGNYLWGNAAWALASRVTTAFQEYGWCAAIRGLEGGGLVEDLPVHNFRTEAGDIAMKCPAEVQITDRREKELADLGFAAMVHQRGTSKAAFFSVQSTQKPKKYDSDAANANAQLSARLPYIFAVSRFAHYLKVMMRDKIGSFNSREKIETELNNWIMNYVVSNSADPKVLAKKPLNDARIEVVEVAGRPGSYQAVAFLKPHFQLEEMGISMRLVADLPQYAGG